MYFVGPTFHFFVLISYKMNKKGIPQCHVYKMTPQSKLMNERLLKASRMKQNKPASIPCPSCINSALHCE